MQGHFAAENGHAKLSTALIELGANLEAKDNEGCTALHFAAGYGHVETVIALIKLGAILEAKDNEGCTALHFAVLNRHAETVKALIIGGANLEAKNNYEWTALQIAVLKGHTETVEILALFLLLHALHYPANNNGPEIIKILAQTLIQCSENLERKFIAGWTALHYAAYIGQTETVEALLKVVLI